MTSRTLTFATSNEVKFLSAKAACESYAIKIERKHLDLEEIQADNGEAIANFKADQAYVVLQKPVVVTDDTWIIPGLNGFPGPYMKYMNEWLSSDDFLRLTNGLTDRRIILRQTLVYKDAATKKAFSADNTGVILHAAHGTSPYTHLLITSFDGGKHSAAEEISKGVSALAQQKTAWHQLCQWLSA